jgi:hypothetical protein
VRQPTGAKTLIQAGYQHQPGGALCPP